LDFTKNIYDWGYVASDYEKQFYRVRSGFMTGETWMTKQLKKYMNANLLFVPYPVTNVKEPYTALATSAPVISLVESGTHKPETMALIKKLYNTEIFDTERKSFLKYLNKESQNVYDNMLKNFTLDYSNAFFEDLSFRNSLMSDILNNTISNDVVKNKYVPLIERAIKNREKTVKLSRVPVEINW
jgi:hypothetical protein